MTAIAIPTPRARAKTPHIDRPRFKLLPSIAMALPMMLLSAMLITQGQIPEDPALAAALGITWVLFNTAFFLMLFTGRTDRFRAILFVTIALSMIVTFSYMISTERGNVALSQEDMINGRTPFCHMVIPMTIIPAALTGTVIFPGSLLGTFAPIAMMVVLWLLASVVLGRGFCSWMCFYGGLDDACSRLAKKPLLRKIDRRWIYFPFALLLVIVLISAVTLSPTYCEWLCPFKAVTEYAAVTNILTLIQTILFVALFVGLVLVLPFLTRRRVQCGLFCPFGAMQSFTNKANIFDIRIDPQKCSGCQRCITTCPTLSLDENSLQTGRTLMTCTKCGKCVDTCTKSAISFHVKGTGIGSRPRLARMLFLYPAFLLMVAFMGGNVAVAIWRVIQFAGGLLG
jgi:ferredoxin-type protein NapH